MSVTVRPARPGDGRRIEEIRVAGWHAAYAALLDPAWHGFAADGASKLLDLGGSPEEVRYRRLA